MQLQDMWMLDELQDGNLSLHLQRNYVTVLQPTTAHSNRPSSGLHALPPRVMTLHLGLSWREGISAAWILLSCREEQMPGQMPWPGVLPKLAVGTRTELQVSVLAQCVYV